MYKAFTFAELLVIRKALYLLPASIARTSLLRKCNEELSIRQYPSIQRIDQSSRQTP